MNEGLSTSTAGRKLVESFESCLKRLGRFFTTYHCPADVLTIGWGHTNTNGRKFKDGDAWTQGECDAALREDLAVAECAVKRRVKVELTQPQFDALSSFVMNCGEGNFARSTLLRKINAKDFDQAAEEFAPWNRGGGRVLNGLTRRRKAEADLFVTGNHEMVHAEYKADPEANEPCPQQVDIPAGTPKPMSESKIGNTQIAVGAAGAIEAASKAKEALDQANSIKQGAKDLGVMDALAGVAASPMFWLAVAIVVAAGCAWYWRRQHAQNGV
jgi:lysozyme